MNDITRVFLELENKSHIPFVAANIANLPSLSVGNFDVLSVVQDVEALKASMAKVVNSQDVMCDLMNQQIKELASHNRLASTAPRASHAASGGLHAPAASAASGGPTAPAASAASGGLPAPAASAASLRGRWQLLMFGV